ncbi:MAG: right-handed parallel beta-helix repeat-containing protein [Paracoccaceae bacterium]
MNKAITDGLIFQPLPFRAGLGVWSSGDGRPGSDTYAGSGTGVFVSADQDFSGCLELQKTQTVTRLRYMAETPILPGCYLRVSARVKAIAGAFPAVRVSGYPGAANGSKIGGLPEFGPAVQLDTYGEVVEVSAIIGTGDRTGVDMVWPGAVFGHLGVELTGPNGGIVRIDDIRIEDISAAFRGELVARVDVRDFGAIGNGSTDCSDAFEAADAAANGREILIPAGTYKLAKDVTLENPTFFQGRVTQVAGKRLILKHRFNYETYRQAFGNEQTAFQKAYQALLNFSDHESLDLCGYRITLTTPVDMQAADPARDVFESRRVIRNGQFETAAGAAWTTTTVTSSASYSSSAQKRLSNVANVANIPVGSLVQGAGVGREVYVTSRNIGAQTVEISQPLYGAQGTQTFTFRRFKYMLDFSGYTKFSNVVLDDIEFVCGGEASGILLPPAGLINHIKDCQFNRPKDRAITSPGRGCQGLMIDRCNFVSNEQPLPVQSRSTIAFNANANDVKVRDNRASRFRHFGLLCGAGNLITGNHWFCGDDETNGIRVGGLILTLANSKSIVTGNYVDNNAIELTNEHEATPDFANQFSFGGLTITGNIFTCNDVADYFSFITIKPFGSGHFIHGLSVVSNVFRSLNGNVDRVERIDTSFGGVDYDRMRAVTFADNSFHGVTQAGINPVTLQHDQTGTSGTWTMGTDGYLPFGGKARFVDAVAANGPIRTGSNAAIFDAPHIEAGVGTGSQAVRLTWSQAVKGKVRFQVRMDNPL